MSPAEAQKLIEECAAKLGEHFEAVQILASWTDQGVTHGSKRGCGNWYARQGLAHEFINQDMAHEHAVQIAEHLNPPDDSDTWKKENS